MRQRINRKGWRRLTLGFLGTGFLFTVIASVGLLLSTMEAFLQGYMVAFHFWIGMSLGGLIISAINEVTAAPWGKPLAAPLRANAWTAPFIILLLVPILIGSSNLFPWARESVVAENELLQRKEGFLNQPFFVLRSLFYVSVWIAISYSLSARKPGCSNSQGRGAAALILLFLTGSFAAIDWAMSLEPRWWSTGYPLLYLSGAGLQAMALMLAVALLVPLNGADDQRNNLGKILLVFAMFWAYLGITHYLIIWNGNIAGDSIWYEARGEGGWQYLAFVLLLFLLALPFFMLIASRCRRNLRTLAGVCALIISFRVLDVYWNVAPAFSPGEVAFLWMAPVLLLAVGGFWLAAFTTVLRRATEAEE